MSSEKKILGILDKHTKQLDRIEKLLKSETTNRSKSKIKFDSKPTKSTILSLLLSFKDDNFFDHPRTLGDIVERFRAESRQMKTTGLTLPLQKLVRNRDLTRVMKDGHWAYVKKR